MSKIKTKEEFIKESKLLYGEDSLDYSLVDYQGNKKKVTLICKKHGTIFSIRPNNHLSGKQFGCPDCKKESLNLIHKKSLSQFIRDVESIYGKERFDLSEVVYINEKTEICIISHKINPTTGKEFGKYYITPDVLLRGYFNEIRGNSIGETLISTCLDKFGITYKNGFKVRGLGADSGLVFIDFSLEYKNKKIWIEYNGIQHYKYEKFFHESFESYLNQKRRDDNVRKYCEENNIFLIEIPYLYKNQAEINGLLEKIIINGEFDYKIKTPKRQ